MKLFSSLIPEGDTESHGKGSALFAAAVGVLFLIVATPKESALAPFELLIDLVYDSPPITHVLAGLSGKFASSSREEILRLVVASVIIPIKKLGFLFSVATLLYFALKNLKRAPWLWIGWGTRLRKALLMSVILACLVLPLQLRSLGDSYAQMSLSPFEEGFGILYRRLLMPALANTIGLSGYVFYLLFSIGLAVVLVYVVLSWFDKNGVHVSRIVVLSLFTSSFVLYGFELPGYPDQLAMILFMLMMVLPESPYGRLSLVALSLATHEASIVMILPAAFLMFTKRERQGAMGLIVAYALFVLTGQGFDVAPLFQAHMYFDATGNSAWAYLMSSPLLAVAGIFVAFKLFWLLGFGAAIEAWRNADRAVARTVLTSMLLPLAIVLFAVDTSRFAGFGFFGLLVALQYVVEHEVFGPKTLRALSLANLILPSVYVGLNSGVMMFPGLYRVVYGWVM